MDSDESRDSSSDNESGNHSARSLSKSLSRSVSPEMAQHSPTYASRDSSPADTPDSPSSEKYHSSSPSRPKPPKSVPSNSSHDEDQKDIVDEILSPNSRNQSVEGISSRSSSPDSKKSNNFDRNSVRQRSVSSTSSRNSQSSKSSRHSSRHSKSGQKSDDGNSSDSSSSSEHLSNRKHIPVSKHEDIQAEEISDGDIESDDDKKSDALEKCEPKINNCDVNIAHEDLSDVSDLEDSIGDHSDDETKINEANEIISNEEIRSCDVDVKKVTGKTSRPEDPEEQLDFEAEDGECGEIDEPKQNEENFKAKEDHEIYEIEEGETTHLDDHLEEKKKEDLEEGEVSDEDDARPEETEPRPVCRFFSRGQCTWGASCRFLHPGVTDKGNYTMFEMIRPVLPGEFDRHDRMYANRVEPAPVESAWERGLRTAKEMLRKSIKRKEQDIDFEEKKMNLSLAQEEFDKENGYYGRATSPEPRYVRHVPVEFPVARPTPTEEYYNRRQVVYESEFVPRDRVKSYRELPAYKMPDYYNNKYEEEQAAASAAAAAAAAAAKVKKPKREVIVQRVEREERPERPERPSRGDEWSDPWMRSKSPQGRKGGRKRSYSSGSSYSSSSSSRSSSTHSSYKSKSKSPHSARRRPSRSKRSRHVSPSVIVSERKAANERAAMMNPPAPRKRAPSPGMLRAAASNPPAPSREDQFGRTRSKLAVAAALVRRARGKRSSKSSSESSGSSSSDSDSSGSSSSSSRGDSSPRRPGVVDLSIAKAMDALKGNSSEKQKIKLNLKTPLGSRKPELPELGRKPDQNLSKKRAVNSPPIGDPKSKKAASRREELLKQLKAVEDAIAKKRSKVN